MINSSKLAKEFMDNGKLTSFPIIDAHAHMGANYGTYMSKATADEMVEIMDRENIEMIFSAPHSALFDPGIKNRELEEAMIKYPNRIMGYYAFNPNYTDIYLDGIEDVLNISGYIGLKFLPTYHRYPLDGENYREALEFANKNKLMILIHTWGNNDPHNGPSHIKKAAEKYTDATFIMGHSAPGELDLAIDLAKTHDNVLLDICDIHRHSGIIDKMVESVGADKVLFGTDIPWYDPSYCLGSILFSHISDDDKYKIIYGNAKKIADRYKK